MKISICIDMIFSHIDFYERLKKVREFGFDAAEFWFWHGRNIERIKETPVSIFNLDSAEKELSYRLSRGILNSGNAGDFIKALNESIPVYKELNARGLIVLIGENAAYSEENVLLCLNAAVPILERENVNLLIEPLNAVDRKGYSMPYAKPIFSLLRKLDCKNIKMLYDIYHQNMTGDFSLDEIRENIDIIGHFHVADAPGRHEPGTGNIDYINILSEINKLDYDGCIGLEYKATVPDEKTFGFLREVKNV